MLGGSGGIIGILHSPVLQDGIADLGVPGYILKTLLDVNRPVGALVFVFVVGGIVAVFVGILDSLKPPNFPPGPRWLPFSGDSCAISEKPMTKTTAAKLLKKFGPVVGIRQNNGHRNPIVLALDAASIETVENAARNGFLEYPSRECSEFKISEFTGIPASFTHEINVAFQSENSMKLIENCAHQATIDLFEGLNDCDLQITSSLISETILAALLTAISGRRVKSSLPCLTELHQVLINNSELNCMLYDNGWSENFDNASRAAQYYSKLLMILSDLDEQQEACASTGIPLPCVIESLAQNHRLLSLHEKNVIIGDILIRSNIGHCLVVMAEYLNAVDVRHLCFRLDTEYSLNLTCKETCYQQCISLIYHLSKILPPLKVGTRWKVLKSFYLNGFTVPQGSFVQPIFLIHRETYSIKEEWSPYETRVMDLIGRVLTEISFYPQEL